MIDFIVGTRPELIKVAPIIKCMRKSAYRLIFTGQHYDYNMSLKFMEEMRITADISKKLTSSGPLHHLSEMMKFLGVVFKENKTEYVVSIGDTNSAVAGALSALQCKIKPIHVEAGLRSYDQRMIEEHNRIICDHISEALFAPTILNRKTLRSEKVRGKIFVTGNPIIDAVKQNISDALKNFKVDIPSEYILLTLHRAENVDDEHMLKLIIKSLLELNQKIVFPLHPRTLKRLKQFNLYDKITNSKIKLIEPVGYFDFLVLMKQSKLVITDSGGVQEECTSPIISKHIVVLRKSTERIESVKCGYSVLPALTSKSIVSAVKELLSREQLAIKKSPYGDGSAGIKIAKILESLL
jgi:UDP-N-acetylglucosamine 2-epimerase (non-hydrolysing)